VEEADKSALTNRQITTLGVESAKGERLGSESSDIGGETAGETDSVKEEREGKKRPRLLPGMPKGDELKKTFEKRGIKVRVGIKKDYVQLEGFELCRVT